MYFGSIYNLTKKELWEQAKLDVEELEVEIDGKGILWGRGKHYLPYSLRVAKKVPIPPLNKQCAESRKEMAELDELEKAGLIFVPKRGGRYV